MLDLEHKNFTLRDFSYELPPGQIAQHPSTERQAARLLYRTLQGQLRESRVGDLPKLLSAGSLVVVNNTRVIAGRLQGRFAGGGRCELFLLGKPEGSTTAVLPCFGYPMRKLKLGKEIFFPAGLVATVQGKSPRSASAGPSTPQVEVEFTCSGDQLAAWLPQHGFVPLPPYIKRGVGPVAGDSEDSARYQTVYAHCDGSLAAPTAGLHFSAELLAELRAREIEIAAVTLHVGAGTFLPVKSADLSQHPMHSECYQVPAATLSAIMAAKKAKRKIILVGTTTLRCLESLYLRAGKDEAALPALADNWWSTDLFIYPTHEGDRYQPWVGDALLTNFHQPNSTLYMLVCALLGREAVAEMYQHALQKGFRFLSYGDTSLLEYKSK